MHASEFIDPYDWASGGAVIASRRLIEKHPATPISHLRLASREAQYSA